MPGSQAVSLAGAGSGTSIAGSGGSDPSLPWFHIGEGGFARQLPTHGGRRVCEEIPRVGCEHLQEGRASARPQRPGRGARPAPQRA